MFIFCINLLFLTETGFADYSGVSSTNEDHVEIMGSLLINLPQIERHDLVDHMSRIRLSLLNTRRMLQEQRQDADISGVDVAIIGIVPGGLLYGGYKAAKLNSINNAISDISWHIDDFASAINDLNAVAEFRLAIR